MIGATNIDDDPTLGASRSESLGLLTMHIYFPTTRLVIFAKSSSRPISAYHQGCHHLEFLEKSYSFGASFLTKRNVVNVTEWQEHADHLYERKIRPCNHLKIAQGLSLAADKKTDFLLT